MKTNTLLINACGCVASLAAVAASPTVWAQAAPTNVTMYAVVDAGVTRDNGRFAAGPVNSQVSGGETANRLGFKGLEDLGGGMAAIYNLEMGYNIDDGSLAPSAGLLFGRKAWVGLQGNFGAVKLGRQDSTVYTYAILYDPMADGLGGNFSRIFVNNATFRRNDNTVDYVTPNWSGFSAEAAYSAGEVAGNSDAGRGYFGSLVYAQGPLHVSLSYQNNNSKPVAPAPIVTTRLMLLGGAYDFKLVKLAAMYQTNKSNNTVRLDGRDMMLGATLPVGAQDKVLISLLRHNDRAAASANANQLALAVTHALSKRTDLYAGISRIVNSSKARFGLAPLASGGSASGTTDKLLTTGIRHVF